MPPPLVEVHVEGVVFSMTQDTAGAVRAGELDPDVGCMQGRIKVGGDVARMYDVLPLAGNDTFLSVLGVPRDV